MDLVPFDMLQAACECVLPSDDGPGAAEAGVAEYVAAALKQERMRAFAPHFELGLEFLQTLANERHQQDFVACDAPARNDVMTEASKTTQPVFRAFFVQLVNLCLEGYLCDPRHQGNRNQAGWSYLDYTPDPEPPNHGEALS